MLLALGVVSALFERDGSGEGQVLDVAIVDGVALLLTSIFQLDAQGLWSHERGTNCLDGAAPWYQLYMPATWDETEKMVRRVEAAGCRVLTWTIDLLAGHLARPGRRREDAGRLGVKPIPWPIVRPLLARPQGVEPAGAGVFTMVEGAVEPGHLRPSTCTTSAPGT